MSRYIDADELIFFRFDNPDCDNLFEFVPKEFIDNAPTADVVEVVRCKDCKYYRKNISCVGGLYNGCSEYLNEGNEIEVREDDYCSYAERVEDEREF